MQQKDYSREIYERYFNTEKRVLKIVLKDRSVLEGIFVAFTHGDDGPGAPFIKKWHFVPEKDIENYRHEILMEETMQGYGKMIDQDDIESVTFKQ